MAKRQIAIEWVELETKVVADLLDDQNPELCSLLWEHLPYASIQLHALISGEHLYHYNPIVESMFARARHMESRMTAPRGTIFLSYLQHLSIKYGKVNEDLPAAPIGRVVDADLERLAKAGRGCWESTCHTKKLIEVRVTRAGEKFDPAKVVRPKYPPAKDPRVQALIEDIRLETDRIWLEPPTDVVNLHTGNIKSRAGSYNQYFSTIVFANGEERHIGYNAFGGLLKSCVKSDITLDVLRQITPNFVQITAEFLDYCGLSTLGSFTHRMLELLGAVGTKEEYASLLSAMTTYANRINGWNLHYFPWHHEKDHRYADAV